MNFHDLVSDLIIDTKGTADPSPLAYALDSSVAAFLPEIVLCATMVLALLLRLFKWGRRVDTFFVVLAGAVIGLACAFGDDSRMEIFTGMLVYDPWTVFMRRILLGFLVLFVVFTKLTGIPDREDGADIYTLVLGSTVGMCLMASANHLLMVFLAVEMASVPSYALAGLLKGRRKASEAALKYAVYGAGAAGVMLYGISLVAGQLNSAHLPTLAARLAEQLPGMSGESQMVLTLGALLIGVGLAFKLSAVPFHFWCPDVFEGATAEVNAFLSVASKAAALSLLLRVALGFSTLAPESVRPGERSGAKYSAEQIGSANSLARLDRGLFSVADELGKGDSQAAIAPPSPEFSGLSDGEDEVEIVVLAAPSQALAPVRSFIGKLIAFLAILTCTFGNLAAYGQTNIKRLFAYSTIAHAGYMMMAVPPVLAMADVSADGAQRAVAALGVYIFVYVFMNLGAFAVVAFLRNEMGSEEIADYGGLIRRCPVTVICLALMLFSLVGLPPLAGFVGKFAIFASIADGFIKTSQGYLLVLLVFGGLNTAVSLFYYLRVVKVMTMDPEPESRRPFAMPFLSSAFIVALTFPTAALMLSWDWLSELTIAAARHLLG